MTRKHVYTVPPHLDTLLVKLLQEAGKAGMTTNQIRQHFHGNVKSIHYMLELSALAQKGLVSVHMKRDQNPHGGRLATIWRWQGEKT
jgi:hypothetical protein